MKASPVIIMIIAAVLAQGTQVKQVAGCVGGKPVLEHRNGRKGVVEAEITRRFGPDVLVKTEEEVQRNTQLPANATE